MITKSYKPVFKILVLMSTLLTSQITLAIIRIQPDNPTENSNISIQGFIGCHVVDLIDYQTVNFEVHANFDVTYCNFGGVLPGAWSNNFIGSLPAGDYQFLINLHNIQGPPGSINQMVFNVTVGPAPRPVPFNSLSWLIAVLLFTTALIKLNQLRQKNK